MDDDQASRASDRVPGARRRAGARRIRRKLILLHTVFSLTLGVFLIIALRPAIRNVVLSAQEHACRVALDAAERIGADSIGDSFTLSGVTVEVDPKDLTADERDRLAVSRSEPVRLDRGIDRPTLAAFDPDRGAVLVATGFAPGARGAMRRLNILVILAILVVYALIAVAMETFILPRNVWRPIARLREADAAVQAGVRARELIPESDMPHDELGEIMRTRNDSIRKLRAHEDALASALDQLETVANDLKRKNHLLESVQRNMADQDRLMSLGMMSAGLAHELNTPLAVLKGAIEEIAEKPEASVGRARADLLSRTVSRLERLSENLLDFARVRPHTSGPVDLRRLIDDAWELVRLDREAGGVSFDNRLSPALRAAGDADRLGQVFVNILRNAADAIDGAGGIVVRAERASRDGADWISVHVTDTGPGIGPDILPRLFDPFTTTRLDARGTGLGLAVAEGIVREHGGVILARNAPKGGAVFEVMLPMSQPDTPHANEAQP